MNKVKSDELWLNRALPLYENLTKSVVSLISNILTEAKVDYLSVTGRTKTLDAALEKIQRKNYSDPKNQMTDLCGVRIITYFESQVSIIGNIIKETFEVDEKNSLDLDQLLGRDKIGYRSVHYVCTLGRTRERLPEYQQFKGMCFEIQLRTVLQHAWAELAHDRSYKFSGELPSKLQRKLNLYAGTLELVDKGFDEIALEADKYERELEKTDISEILDKELDSINVTKFLKNINLKENLGLKPIEIDRRHIAEIKDFGIKQLAELNALVSPKIIKAQKENNIAGTYIGFLRTLLMYNDIRKYFENSWKNSWHGLDRTSYEFLKGKFGDSIMKEIVNKHDLDLLEE